MAIQLSRRWRAADKDMPKKYESFAGDERPRQSRAEARGLQRRAVGRRRWREDGRRPQENTVYVALLAE